MPTLKQKVEVYERLLHKLQILYELADYDKIEKQLNKISDWSYAHRVGNGTLSMRQQNKLIRDAFNKLI